MIENLLPICRFCTHNGWVESTTSLTSTRRFARRDTRDRKPRCAPTSNPYGRKSVPRDDHDGTILPSLLKENGTNARRFRAVVPLGWCCADQRTSQWKTSPCLICWGKRMLR